METLTRNVRLGIRSLARTPGFAVVAILTLGLGIGLSTAVFTVADALLFRRLPVRDQERLVALWGETRDRSFSNVPLSLAQARTFARETRTLSAVAFFTYEGSASVPIRTGSRITQINQALVSGNYFDVTGTHAILGRTLARDDDLVGAAPVVVLSHRAWQRYFGGDPRIVGRQIVLHANGVAHTIVGVLPQGFDYPRGADFWGAIVPARTRPGEDTVYYAAVNLLGRLRPDASAQIARDELTAFFRRSSDSQFQRDAHAIVRTLPRIILGDVRPAVIAFAVAVALLLVITCVNVANLLFVRGLSRVREVAVRCALGAGRGHVIMQLVTENLLLALAGGILGLLVAAFALRSFVSFAPADLPRLDEIRVDVNALAGAVGITGVAVLLFGLAPALMTSRVELEQLLRADGRQSASRVSRLTAELLVAGQVALAVLVLAAAGVVVRSLEKLEHATLAFDPTHVLVAPLAIRSDLFDAREKQIELLDRIMASVKTVPGVTATSPVVAVPFSFTAWDGRPLVEGQGPEQAASNPVLNMEVVDPSYFSVLDIPIVRGRGFSAADREGAPRVTMLSESAARQYWPDDDPIGKRVRMGSDVGPMTVIGIVPDTRYRDLRDARPSIYFPLHQSFFPFSPTNLLVRVGGDPAALAPMIRRALEAVDPGVAPVSVAPLQTFLTGPLAQPRLNALLLSVFAGSALALAATGLFGVMATMVRQRMRELGIRMALGATAADIRSMVVRRGLAITATGILPGIVAALLANRFLQAILYEVRPDDIVTLTFVALVLLVIAVIATGVPARTSTRIDPTIALRDGY